MKILLPPSETKRPGGFSPALDISSLALPLLKPEREAAIAALVELAQDEEASARVLKLSARQRGEITHNAAIRTAATLPAVDRYTGVLFDALDAESLGTASRAWLHAHVWIHSAPFGPVAALDLIPPYRLSAGTSLPGVSPLRRHFAEATSRAIEDAAPRVILDLRSESYAALGPLPDAVPSAYVRVVTDEGGSSRALNHFNKKSKGLLVRALAEDRPDLGTLDDIRSWATRRGFTLRDASKAGEWELVVSE